MARVFLQKYNASGFVDHLRKPCGIQSFRPSRCKSFKSFYLCFQQESEVFRPSLTYLMKVFHPESEIWKISMRQGKHVFITGIGISCLLAGIHTSVVHCLLTQRHSRASDSINAIVCHTFFRSEEGH